MVGQTLHLKYNEHFQEIVGLCYFKKHTCLMQITVINFAVCLISVKELTKIVKWINDFNFRIGTYKAFKRLNDGKTL